MLRRLPVSLLAAVALTGCPGSIEDPGPFYAAAASACPSDYEVEVDLFQETCAELGCHTGGPALAAAGLDLGAPNVGDRLLAHRSMECDNRPLIEPASFHDSYLLLKVGEDPPCGERMPAGMGALSAPERACLEQYLADLAGVSLDGGAPVPRDGALVDPDAGPRADAGPPMDGGTPVAVTYQAEEMTLTTYMVDAADATVIRLPDGAATGTASTTFDGVGGSYSLSVRVIAEFDGQPVLRVFVADAMVAMETYPLSSIADANEPVTLGPYAVTLSPGDEIRLEGDSNVDAWARIDAVEVTP